VIFIVVKWTIRPQRSGEWLDLIRDFTEATRAEPGNLFFDWSRSVDDPHKFVLVEAFRDGDAGAAHVRSDHFKAAQRDLPAHLVRTPRIVNATVPQDDWSELGELAVRPD
jgi:quinol monooxygenase YgiN